MDVAITLCCDLPEATERAGTSAIEEAAREQVRWFNGGLQLDEPLDQLDELLDQLDEMLDRADNNSIRAVITPAQPAE